MRASRVRDAGLVSRRVEASVQPQVEYALTPFGAAWRRAEAPAEAPANAAGAGD